MTDDRQGIMDEGERAMAMLGGLADAWAEEVDLLSMIESVVSPMRLNRNVPQEVRDQFTHRMKVQIDAICRQCFIEGAMRAMDGLRDRATSEAPRTPEPPSNTDESKYPRLPR